MLNYVIISLTRVGLRLMQFWQVYILQSLIQSWFLCCICHAVMGGKQVRINMLGHKYIPDGLSILDLLLCFSFFYSLFAPLPYSRVFPSSAIFFIVFLSSIIHNSFLLCPCACPCLPSHSPSTATVPVALLLPHQKKWSLPTGNMINRLNLTGYQESLFHLPCMSMGMLLTLQLRTASIPTHLRHKW